MNRFQKWTAKRLKADPQFWRGIALMRRYGMTLDDLAKLTKAQHNRCALCGRKGGNSRSTRLVIDHDHESGRVRGLLCRICNVSLGILGDSEESITRVLKYLKKGHRRGADRK